MPLRVSKITSQKNEKIFLIESGTSNFICSFHISKVKYADYICLLLNEFANIELNQNQVPNELTKLTERTRRILL